jgi:signal transduction histidine kinase
MGRSVAAIMCWSMMKRLMINHSMILALWSGLLLSIVLGATADQGANLMEISTVQVENKCLDCLPGGTVNLGASPHNIHFTYRPVPGAPRVPFRMRNNLDGYEKTWHNDGGQMTVTIWFYNEAGDALSHHVFVIQGESTGWDGTLENSLLNHRRETLTVPAGASRLRVALSSAGLPSAVGVYVMEGLVVSEFSPNNRKQEILLRSPFDPDLEDGGENETPAGWQRGGTHPSMARIVKVGHDPKIKAFALYDDDPFYHAEWRTTPDTAPRVTPKDNVVVEWNEMYSIGNAENRAAYYDALPPGEYRLKLAEVSVFGQPTGWGETLLTLRVPVTLWARPWFLALVATITVVGAALSVRQVARQRLRRAISNLQQQRALEQERLRIARDIHDDLGARATQISLLSALAESDSPFSEQEARAQFDRIALVARDLVSALYETVWAVSPENDNLDAVVNYLCERIHELCDPAQLRCRLHVSPLPQNVGVTSRARHNISLAVKEAMHNVIKHAHASQVTVQINFVDSYLAVSIQDDGCGFEVADVSGGNGLSNMNSRMTDIGGTCRVESGLGKGTTVHLRFSVEPSGADSPAHLPARDASLPEPEEFA